MSFLAPPVVTPEYRSIIGILGQEVTIEYNITDAIPPVNTSDIEWYHLYSPLTNPRLVFSDDRTSLTIRNISLGDEGDYNIYVRHPAGNDYGYTYFYIQGIICQMYILVLNVI